MKIAFVVQRYGQDVLGGAELLCRLVCERLAAGGHEITVYTTCAKEYTTWKNEYPAGETIQKGVVVKRFSVSKQRDMDSFNAYSEWIFSHGHTEKDEWEWLDRQGPAAPDLLEALEKEEHGHDLFIFFTYLYYPTYWGMKRIKGIKTLVPTAHDELPLYLGIMKEVFAAPSALLFNTESEKELLGRHFSLEGKYLDTIGTGVDIPENLDIAGFCRKHGLASPFILYAGRIEPGKGCQELLDYFLECCPENLELSLVLIGNLLMKLPPHPKIRSLGFLSLEEKNSAMAAARMTIHPSHYESLCMAALESLAVKTPILVQEAAAPLKEHCLRGQCGLFYSDAREFGAALTLLLADSRLSKILGENGFAYVQENYSWPGVMGKYEQLFRYLTAPGKSD
jgi:glycosyltransferase involved in cell wall biosynthesis